MIDIHSHILAAVDDGVRDMEESMAIVRESIKEGIKGIVATPHFMEEGYRPGIDEIREKVSRLEEEIEKENLDFAIYPGAEVFVYPGLARDLSEGLIATINDSSYILLEFPMNYIPANIDELFYDLKVMGYKVIISHPERYREIVQDPNRMLNWIEEGVYAQLNAGSLIGFFGQEVQETAEILLRHNMIQFIGSDLHSLEARGQCLAEGVKRLEEIIGEEGRRIIKNNSLIIEDKQIRTLKPTEYQAKKGFFTKFRNPFKR
ncbi:tyrosine-protein phosphatase [Natronospora cellulosivora (SeqCode)]